MRDQNGSPFTQFCPRHPEFHVLHSHPRQSLHPRIRQLKGEQRRHRRLNGVAELPRQLQAAPGIPPTRGDQQPVARHGLPCRELHRETRAHRARAAPGAHDHARVRGCALKAGHDRSRIIGHGEQAAIVLLLELDPVHCEPRGCLARPPAMKRPEQLATPARIMPRQFRRLRACGGDIAPAAARDSHLRQRLGGELADYDARVRVPPGAGDRRKESRGAPADDHDPLGLHPGNRAPAAPIVEKLNRRGPNGAAAGCGAGGRRDSPGDRLLTIGA